MCERALGGIIHQLLLVLQFSGMNFEREMLVDQARLPEDVFEQLKNLPNIEERKEVSMSIFKGFAFLVVSYGFEIDWELSGPRPPKTITRIESKTIRRSATDPMGDIYGGRIVTEDPRRELLVELIEMAYPDTPKFLPWGKPTTRDYRDPEVRASHIEKNNPHMSPLYSALHKNFVFRRKGADKLDIGEIQAMSHEELGIYKLTHEGYNNGNHK